MDLLNTRGRSVKKPRKTGCINIFIIVFGINTNGKHNFLTYPSYEYSRAPIIRAQLPAVSDCL
jgi:hypothetical protein